MERWVEFAITCIAAWAEREAERIRLTGNAHSDRLNDLARTPRGSSGR